MMRTTTAEKLAKLQKTPQNIRNICILAHVDHGKTTLADYLVASNGIISQRMSGKIRYMDSREDEQLRGITMKSSAISLHYVHEQEDYLINLIDSPGHVDFSSEVSTAVRLCDGAIIIVDVIEGVSPQTHAVLRQAWQEGIKPVLLLNKIDRLILELHMEPQEAYLHLRQILEHINVLTSELFTSEWMEKSSNMPLNASEDSESWSADLNMILEEEGDDSNIYFSPDQGNVIFASALDGWGFSISHFVDMYSEKLGISTAVLNKTLWGDYYLNSKAKRIMKGAQAKNKKPLFVQFVLDNIWAVYQAVMIKKDKEMIAKIVNSLNLKISARDSRSDPKVHIQAICSQWLPLSNAVLSMVAKKIPAPTNMSKARIEKLMSSNSRGFESLPQKSQDLRNDFLACSSSEDAPVIIFVSKMVAIERKSLPQHKARPLTEADMQEKRRIALQKRAERLAAKATENTENAEDKQKSKENLPGDPVNNDTDLNGTVEPQSEHVFVAFARIFSGTVRKGCKVFVLGPKHDPEKALQNEQSTLLENSDLTVNELSSGQHIMSFIVQDLYLFMGRELEIMDEVPAGNVLGIGNLEEYVLKTATLCETIACPAFTEMHFEAAPIVRVAIEPQNICDMPNLVKGLRLLNQADPCVEVLVQETGEHVIVAAGEVHLQRCLEDLTDRYANVQIIASSPIVPFRETIITPPKTDMVNEAIVQMTDTKCLRMKNMENDIEEIRPGLIEIQTSNRKCTIHLSAKPLPEEVASILEKSTEVLKYFQAQIKIRTSKGDQLKSTEINHVLDEGVRNLKKQLDDAFSQAGKEWQGFTDHIWSFGPRHVGPNILVNKIPNYQRPSLWNITDDTTGMLRSYDDSIISGFQMATLSGPLCEEPMHGVCFIIEQWDYLDSLNGTSSCCIGDTNGASEERKDLTYTNEVTYGSLSGQLMSTIKDSCRKVFLTQSMRLMVAMYKCDIQATADVLGKLYAVLGKRNGKILHEDMREGTRVFNIEAALPIIESFGFAEDIRKKTSGLASPQLRFSHWEVVDMDPFWEPQTEEEYLHFGEKADSENLARSYMNAVRKRKGLKVNEKIVEHAEKQRTLKKNK
ncbi:elongation factor-like GTPase 1 isoform X1 [Octopus vulgaris]|uniref:Ribosome assembly protein 1 n=1 Tax=Octopus vulgaris TaxID=6645 RepID=A0AA36AKU6_OCTVU|nr:elongation factor-like GTPase 1 isoform X1 [Octopus vulgaris]